MADIQDSSCGKMSPGPFPAAEGGTSNPSSWKSCASKNRRLPRCLCLKKLAGLMPTFSWEMDGALRTVLWTRKVGEFHKGGAESTLSQILQAVVHPKYYLTLKACSGILHRALARGKALPENLRLALERQANA